jgi:tRNA dimethylallyltransferase
MAHRSAPGVAELVVVDGIVHRALFRPRLISCHFFSVAQGFGSVSNAAMLIAGPTASGKSAAALAMAMRIDGVVINADSMQVYAEPRILTARPSDAELAPAPHLLYGHVSVTEHYSVGRYLADAADALAQARAMGRTPIFAGGTGLYFDALTEGIADMPDVPASVREATAARRKELGPEAFFAELTARDPQIASRLRASDTQRTIRAYEVFEATGRSLAYWQMQKGKPLLDGMSLIRFVMLPPRDELYRRIDARFDDMLARGALDEARALAGIDPSLPAAKILGLRELLAVAEGTMTLDDARTLAKTATRQYAKRQMTWFRNRMGDWVVMQSLEGFSDMMGSL